MGKHMIVDVDARAYVMGSINQSKNMAIQDSANAYLPSYAE